LEALAASLPVVATSVGMLPALLREGENGFLVAPRAILRRWLPAWNCSLTEPRIWRIAWAPRANNTVERELQLGRDAAALRRAVFVIG
jgi:glycosyltransferase involved in cell wall biosynthesis